MTTPDPNHQPGQAPGAYPPPTYQGPSQYQQPPGAYQQPPQYGAPQYGAPAPGVEQRSRIAAGVLGILLGSLGVHNFYLGKIGLAVAQLLITVLSLGLLSFVSGIWGLIEGILILTGSPNYRTDGRGVPLRD